MNAVLETACAKNSSVAGLSIDIGYKWGKFVNVFDWSQILHPSDWNEKKVWFSQKKLVPSNCQENNAGLPPSKYDMPTLWGPSRPTRSTSGGNSRPSSLAWKEKIWFCYYYFHNRLLESLALVTETKNLYRYHGKMSSLLFSEEI